MGIFDFFGGGGGSGAGPLPLVPGATAYGLPPGGQDPQTYQPNGGAGFLDALDNPYVAAALGAGGAMLSSADRGESLGDALRSGIGGGAAGLLGAHRRKKAEKEDARRRAELDEIRKRYAMLANQMGQANEIEGPAQAVGSSGMFGQPSGYSGQFSMGGLF